MHRLLSGTLVLTLVAALASAACGDGPDPTPVPTSATAATQAATSPPGTFTPDPNQVVGMSGADFDKLPGIVTTESGLRYVDIKVGVGPTPTEQQRVTFHYTGTLAANGVQFESSRSGANQPITLGVTELIPGFTEALLTMKEGGIRTVYIPAELGYGSTPRVGIPPNSDIIFEIELIAVN